MSWLQKSNYWTKESTFNVYCFLTQLVVEHQLKMIDLRQIDENFQLLKVMVSLVKGKWCSYFVDHIAVT